VLHQPRKLGALSALVLFVVGTPVAGQSAGHAVTQGQFVIRRGKDTVAVERFTRDATSLTGDIVQPAGAHLQYTVLLKPNGTAERVDLTRTPRQGGPITVGVEFGAGSAHATLNGADGREEMDFPTPLPATPFLIQSFAITEQIVRTAGLAPGQQAKWTAVRLGAGDTATVTIARFHPDSVSLTMADVAVTVALDKAGRVVGAVHSRQAWVLERVR
jgi:hypothetical protein